VAGGETRYAPGADLSRQPKVRDFHNVALHEAVFGLDVPARLVRGKNAAVCGERPRAACARPHRAGHLPSPPFSPQPPHPRAPSAPVEKPVLVHKGEALEDLEHHAAHRGLGQRPVARLAHLVEVAVQVLKHEEQLVILPDHLLQLHDAGVAQLAQRAHLAQGHALLPRVELLLHALDGHHLARLPVDGAVHRAVGPIAENLGDFVALHGVSEAW